MKYIQALASRPQKKKKTCKRRVCICNNVYTYSKPVYIRITWNYIKYTQYIKETTSLFGRARARDSRQTTLQREDTRYIGQLRISKISLSFLFISLYLPSIQIFIFFYSTPFHTDIMSVCYFFPFISYILSFPIFFFILSSSQFTSFKFHRFLLFVCTYIYINNSNGLFVVLWSTFQGVW